MLFQTSGLIKQYTTCTLNSLHLPQNLLSKATLKELIIIGMELRCATGRTWYSANSVKADIANIIAKALGRVCSVTVQRRKKKVYNPETLFNFLHWFHKKQFFPC